MSEEQTINACKEREEEISLYLWDELDEDRCEALEQHLENCATCAATVAGERQLLAALRTAAPADPSPEVLAQFRMELLEKIEQAGMPGFWTRLGTVLWPRGLRWSFSGWMMAHPALGAVALVMLGVALGGILPRLTAGPGNTPDFAAPGTMQVTEAASAPRVDFFNVTGIDVAGGQLEVRGSRETPERVMMNLDDPEARDLLMRLIQNGQRFTADTRMKSVEALQALAGNQDVRQSLCNAARNDRNPAVRLRAIEALKGLGEHEMVQQTILEALLRDENPGVRIEAVNALREMVESAATPDRELMRVLRERMVKDPNTYIRLQSAAAVRSVEQRGTY
ncbi:MAG: HEAT repeat domain-containing protein [Candidatus Acidiferrales bacterium]